MKRFDCGGQTVSSEGQSQMTKLNIKTVGGLLVSMEVYNENLMTWGLQESISLFSILLPFSGDSFFSSKIPPDFLSPSGAHNLNLIYTRKVFGVFL